jgi:hypothetical protein
MTMRLLGLVVIRGNGESDEDDDQAAKKPKTG